MKKLYFLAVFTLLTFTPLFAKFNLTTVNGDVIVTDTETGLIWQKNYASKIDQGKAFSYCFTLTYAGYSDWRLPEKNELESLVNFRKKNPASDFPDMPSEYFWSNSSDGIMMYHAYAINFSTGLDRNLNMGNDFNARCVRGKIEKRGSVNSISDSTPKEIGNMLWSNKSPNKMSWNTAKQYCKKLSEGGYNDWRLPNIDELRTLIQNHSGTQTGGSCKISEKAGKLVWSDLTDDCADRNGNNFSKLGDDCQLWSSSVQSGSYGFAWYVNFGYGSVDENDTSDNYYVRCVRNAK